MAVLAGKRQRGVKSQDSRKRQKVETHNSAIAAPNGKTPLHHLPWNEVAFPETFEDAEGFLGLDEVDGVEVVRHSESGEIEFVLSDTVGTISKLSSVSETRQTGAKNVTSAKDNQREAVEWEGFDEESTTAAQETGLKGKSTKDSKENKQKKGDGKAKKKKRPNSKPVSAITEIDTTLHKNEFEPLQSSNQDEVNVSAWFPLGLSSDTLTSLAKLNFARPTPIQSAAIPQILAGHDVIGKASTGSGKTLAFGIPILEHYLSIHAIKKEMLLSKDGKQRFPPVALILSPTRELAHQISAHLIDLCSNINVSGPRIATVTGGLSSHKQQRLLTDVDIIVGTPGRLWETISGDPQLSRSLKKLKFLVVDEADRLLHDGHFKEVEEIINSLDREDESSGKADLETFATDGAQDQRQTLVFSATFQKELQYKLLGKSKSSSGSQMDTQESLSYLVQKLHFRHPPPKFIDVNSVSQMATHLREGILECSGAEKDLYLYALFLHSPSTRTLTFTNSIASVRRLTALLQRLGLSVLSLHSQMPQKARLRAIERFSSSSSATSYSILVATDVAARGLDIPTVQLVVHYHVPRAADAYVHRSGRTARAGLDGESILLCAPEEVVGVRRLVAKIHARYSHPQPPSSAHTAAAASQTPSALRTIHLDRRIVARLKRRITLAKTIADSALAKEKGSHEDNWLQTAAEELGVEYDGEEFAAAQGSTKGRGRGRMQAEMKARRMGKAEIAGLRAELMVELGRRVNVGVSERYLSAGGVDVDGLLEEGEGGKGGGAGGEGRGKGRFLGRVEGLGLD